jgi:hypothetical protein
LYQGLESRLLFIPSLGSKRVFFENFEDLTQEEKQAKEMEKLEYSFDTFPLSNEDSQKGAFFKWVKQLPDIRSPLYFSVKPNFVNEEVFFKVMNGLIPKTNNNR